jgi:hypothetical protein
MAIQSESNAPSRRAVLAGLLGGIGAWTAGVVGRQPVRAADGNPVIIGVTNSSTSPTRIDNTGLSLGFSASTNGGNAAAVVGTHVGDASGAGVIGSSHSSEGFGVKGEVDGAAATGVYGYSTYGHAIHGDTYNGWAGYFDGKVLVKHFLQLREMPAPPAAPAPDYARVFVRDNGSGKTQLCVRFHNGVIRVLATA